jgi:hypothetical protein
LKEIKLAHGYAALVDDHDYEYINQFKWHALVQKSRSPSPLIRVYAVRNYIAPSGKYSTQRMHRLILGITDAKLDVDHRDGDGLNNCRGNLRVATRLQNGSNQRKRANSNTYKGVCFDKSRKLWMAGIKVNYKRLNLGRFPSELEAAQIYDIAAQELHGEFARLNFPESQAA